MITTELQETNADITRKGFLNFYNKLGYKIIPGSSMLDPSVSMSFVMSAGLSQVETSAKQSDGKKEKRYALIQNCFRYFDMDIVGNSPIHLSFFQMPGAFSFAPISKSDCVLQIWKLLTKTYCIQPERLWATYFSGDTVCNHMVPPDTETRNAWRLVGIPSDHIIGLNAEHNFWKQSSNIVGQEHVPKCGVHTEVFFDRGNHLKCGNSCLPGCNCGRFVEIMNTLFINLHIDDLTGEIKLLEEPFTETVIGAERVSMILQNVPTVYDIDSIFPLVRYVDDLANPLDLNAKDISKHIRIITDHVRALVFLIADGAPKPGKGGRARLIRKLIREMLTSLKLLNIDSINYIEPLIEVSLILYDTGKLNLAKSKPKIISYINAEKECFDRTLKNGFRQIKRTQDYYMPGMEIVRMEKKYGVPFPLLEGQLKKRKIKYSFNEYKMAYKQWKQGQAI